MNLRKVFSGSIMLRCVFGNSMRQVLMTLDMVLSVLTTGVCILLTD